MTASAASGIVLLDKPLGLSSHSATQRIKRLLRASRAGHVGSLDPLATGMLPVCLGEATKIALGHALGGAVPGADLVVFGVLLILCVAFAPRGLLGLGADVRRLLRRPV